MQIECKLDQLRSECIKRNIPLLEGYKYKRKEYVALLGKWSLEHPEVLCPERVGRKPWGLTQVLKYESPMLCFTYDKLSEEEKEELNGPGWLAQEKVNGVRCFVTFMPGEGLRIFTRATNPKDWLPTELTGKFLVDGEEPEWNHSKYSFVMDCELVLADTLPQEVLSEYMGVVDRGNASSTLLNATSIVVHCSKEMVRKCPVQFIFKMLDLLQFNGMDLTPYSYQVRKQYLHTPDLFTPFESWSFDSFVHVLDNTEKNLDAESFYSYILENGGEGVVYRNLDKPYLTTESRKKDYMVKRKPVTTGNEIDGYVSGVLRNSEGRIVTVNISVCDPYGDRVVGRVNFFSPEDRERLFELSTITLQEELKPGWLGAVVRFTGADFDKAQGVYRRVSINWTNDVRLDKTPMNCDGSELADMF